MKTKQFLLGVILSLLLGAFTFPVRGQTNDKADTFEGARATKDEYKAVFALKSGDKDDIQGVLRNIHGVLNDPRLEGKVKLELVVYSKGINLFLKKNKDKYGAKLKEFADQGVIMAACHNTMRGMGLDKSELLPFVSVVPSGAGELVVRGEQGWAIIFP